MTITSIDTDLATLTLVMHSAFDAPVEQVWQIWADPYRNVVVGSPNRGSCGVLR